jgi:hypothetical protein
VKEMIDKQTKKALFIEIHRAIELAASHVINVLEDSNQELEITYPPHYAPLTPEEKTAIRDLPLSDVARSALKKIMLDAASHPSFQLFALMDGVASPETGDFDVWYGVSFCPKEETNELMLHDELYDSFWDYEEMSKTS